MAVTARDIYNLILYDLAEDGGLVLGLLTVDQFLELLSMTISDFCLRTCAVKRIYTQTIFGGQSQYTVPDDIERVDIAFVAGNRIQRSDQTNLSNENRNWRVAQGTPKNWHDDGIPIKTVEIILTPIFNGTYINGPNEPDPPHAVYDSFSAMGQNARQLRALSIVGPRKPAVITILDQTIDVLPDDIALSALPFGVLERIFSGDNELRELQCAAWCGAQYRESIALLAAVTGEVVEEGIQQ